MSAATLVRRFGNGIWINEVKFIDAAKLPEGATQPELLTELVACVSTQRLAAMQRVRSLMSPNLSP